MLSKIQWIAIAIAVLVVVGLVLSLQLEIKENDTLIAEKELLHQKVIQLDQIAKQNAQAAVDAFRSRELIEAAMMKATEDRNRIQKKWASLHQQFTEAVRYDPETRDWESTAVPASVYGILLEAGGIRSPGSD